MLKLIIPEAETYDESTKLFQNTRETKLSLEHSLVSVSKWESKWCVPFLSKSDKTTEQSRDYVKCMTLTQNVDDSVYNFLTQENLDTIRDYIEAPMSATKIVNTGSSPSREIVTSELIYHWMVALNIPFECQKWHLNRLLKLIEVCSIKNQSPRKMRGKALARNNAALNAQRKAAMNTRG